MLVFLLSGKKFSICTCQKQTNFTEFPRHKDSQLEEAASTFLIVVMVRKIRGVWISGDLLLKQVLLISEYYYRDDTGINTILNNEQLK